MPAGPGCIFELGSGAGYLRQSVPEAIRARVFSAPKCDLSRMRASCHWQTRAALTGPYEVQYQPQPLMLRYTDYSASRPNHAEHS
jgi:hypothetical protein